MKHPLARICVIRQNLFAYDPRVQREVAALVDAGHEVDVICLRGDGEPLRERRGRLTVYRVPSAYPRSRSSYLVSYSCFLGAAAILCGLLHLRRPYALVQVHSLPDVLVFAAVVPKLLGARVVLDLHEMMVEFFCTKFQVDSRSLRAKTVAFAEQASIRFADFAFTCTNEMREAFIGRGADAEKLGVVLNASDEEVFDVERHPPHGSSEGEYVLICHGSVEERYGVDTTIRAVALLHEEIPGLRLEVYGKGTYLEEGRRLARDLGVGDRVRFSDAWVPFSTLLEAIAAADAGVVAIKRDPFRDLTHCNKMYDLVTMRRPVLIARTRSVEAYFDENCFEYFESDDPEGLADGIRRLYGNPRHAEELVARAAEALEPYRWPRQREIYRSYIEALLMASDAKDGRVGRLTLTARGTLDRLFSRTLRPYFVSVRDALDRRVERRHGLDTFGKVLMEEHDAERGFYKPLPWGALARILSTDDVGPDDVFIDLGAGKGRAVFLAAGYPFKRVIGVELAAELSAVARANIEQVRDRLACQQVEIVTADVLAYEIPDDVTVVFFYNPFQGEVFASAIRRLLESVDRRPRRVRVIYVYPTQLEYLQSTGRFRLVRRVRGWRPTREWARSYEILLLEVLPSPANAQHQAS